MSPPKRSGPRQGAASDLTATKLQGHGEDITTPSRDPGTVAAVLRSRRHQACTCEPAVQAVADIIPGWPTVTVTHAPDCATQRTHKATIAQPVAAPSAAPSAETRPYAGVPF